MTLAHVSPYPFFSMALQSIHGALMLIVEYLVWNMLVSETIIRKNVNKLIKYLNISSSDCKTTFPHIKPIIMLVKNGDTIMMINTETYDKSVPDYDLILKLYPDSRMIVTDNIDHISNEYSPSGIGILSVTLDICGTEYDITPSSSDPNLFICGNKLYSMPHIKFICKERDISDYDEKSGYKVTIIDSDINSYVFKNDCDEKSHILVGSDKLIIHNDIKK
jgi:hypothetical protein